MKQTKSVLVLGGRPRREDMEATLRRRREEALKLADARFEEALGEGRR